MRKFIYSFFGIFFGLAASAILISLIIFIWIEVLGLPQIPREYVKLVVIFFFCMSLFLTKLIFEFMLSKE